MHETSAAATKRDIQDKRDVLALRALADDVGHALDKRVQVRGCRVDFDPPLLEGGMNSYPSEPATYGITFSKNWD